MSPVLEGIRVAEFGQYIAAPAVGAQLAALGAEVVKVEPRQGEVCRHLGVFGEGIFRAHNRGKRSLGLDLGTEEGREAAARLISASDVVVQNMRPGGMERLGLGYEALAAEDPGLIYASVSGYGRSGPSRDRPGLDIAAQAESGLMSVVGERGGEPLRVPAPIVDQATGHVLTQGILAALLHRERTHRGTHVEASLLDVALSLQSTMFQEYQASGTAPERCGNGQAAAAPAADLVRTADGYVVISAYTPSAWSALCGVLGRPELRDDPRFATSEVRVAHRRELLEQLSEAMHDLPTEEAVGMLDQVGVVAGNVRNYPQVLAAPDVVSSGIVTHHRDGNHSFATPYLIGGERPRTVTNLPEAGAETREVLAELGFTPEQIEAWHRRGVAGCAVPKADGVGPEGATTL